MEYEEINPTHALSYAAPTLFCKRCGAYATKKVILLGQTCRMKVKQSSRRMLANLMVRAGLRRQLEREDRQYELPPGLVGHLSL